MITVLPELRKRQNLWIHEFATHWFFASFSAVIAAAAACAQQKRPNQGELDDTHKYVYINERSLLSASVLST